MNNKSDKLYLRGFIALNLFFFVLIVGTDLYEKNYMPLPQKEVYINSTEAILPKSVENVIDGENLMVSINTGLQEELELLPGIGEKIAKNIIDYRTKNGGFKNIEEIMMVDRIGEKLFQKIKNNICI